MDGTTPAAVLWGVGSKSVPGFPFSVVGLQQGVLEIEDLPTMNLQGLASDGKVQVPKPDFITYKFSVIIQRLRDGAIGIIDPYIENEN